MAEPAKKGGGSLKRATTYSYPNGAKVRGRSFSFRTSAS